MRGFSAKIFKVIIVSPSGNDRILEFLLRLMISQGFFRSWILFERARILSWALIGLCGIYWTQSGLFIKNRWFFVGSIGIFHVFGQLILLVSWLVEFTGQSFVWQKWTSFISVIFGCLVSFEHIALSMIHIGSFIRIKAFALFIGCLFPKGLQMFFGSVSSWLRPIGNILCKWLLLIWSWDIDIFAKPFLTILSVVIGAVIWRLVVTGHGLYFSNEYFL